MTKYKAFMTAQISWYKRFQINKAKWATAYDTAVLNVQLLYTQKKKENEINWKEKCYDNIQIIFQ